MRSDQVRTAVLLGSAIPLLMFLLWNTVIIGSIEPIDPAVAAYADASNNVSNPLASCEFEERGSHS